MKELFFKKKKKVKPEMSGYCQYWKCTLMKEQGYTWSGLIRNYLNSKLALFFLTKWTYNSRNFSAMG